MMSSCSGLVARVWIGNESSWAAEAWPLVSYLLQRQNGCDMVTTGSLRQDRSWSYGATSFIFSVNVFGTLLIWRLYAQSHRSPAAKFGGRPCKVWLCKRDEKDENFIVKNGLSSKLITTSLVPMREACVLSAQCASRTWQYHMMILTSIHARFFFPCLPWPVHTVVTSSSPSRRSQLDWSYNLPRPIPGYIPSTCRWSQWPFHRPHYSDQLHFIGLSIPVIL
jgi:hypothetical protein